VSYIVVSSLIGYPDPTMDIRLIAPVALVAVLLFSKKAAAAPSTSINVPSGDAFTRWDALFKKYGAQYGVPPKWLKAICIVESALGTNERVALGLKYPAYEKSVSYDNLSYGLMQLTVATANDMEKGTHFVDLNDPEKAVRIGAKFVAWVMKQFPNEPASTLPEKVFKSYNQGVAGTKKGYKGADPYWVKIQKALAEIQKKQPTF